MAAPRFSDEIPSHTAQDDTKTESSSGSSDKLSSPHSVIVGKERSPPKRKEYRYGWGRFTPDVLQCMNRPQILLFCLSVLLAVQGMLVNGIIPASISHIERRFQFTTAEIGALASAYDVGVVIMLLPISHYGSKGHKGRWIGAGALVTGIASLVCVAPHFFADAYHYEKDEPELVCDQGFTTSTPVVCKRATNTIAWKVVFFVAQFLFGVASSPQFTIAIAYLDENVSQKSSGVYIGIYSACIIIGPCIGYGAAAFLSRIYGYPMADLSKLPMKSNEDPRWYGSWWMGVIAAGIISWCVAVPIFGFGRELPGKDKLRKKDVDEAHHQKSMSLQLSNSLTNWISFKRQLKIVLQNPTYVCLILEQVATLFIVASFAVFSTKYLEIQYSMTTARASTSAAITAIPPAFVGSILGVFIQRRCKLKCAGNVIFSIMVTVYAVVCWATFFFVCPTRGFGGANSFMVDENITATQSSDARLVVQQCHSHCDCSGARFEPYCWTKENISFYSKCHAGCDQNLTTCTCAPDGTVIAGLCSIDCSMYSYPFLVGLALIIALVYVKRMPVQQAILRCVPFELRTFALALGWIPMKLLGSIPANPAVGMIMKNACILWEEQCGERTDVCLLYDNQTLAINIQFTGVVGFFVAYLALVVAWRMYKPPPMGELEAPSERSIFQEALQGSSKEPPVIEPS